MAIPQNGKPASIRLRHFAYDGTHRLGINGKRRSISSFGHRGHFYRCPKMLEGRTESRRMSEQDGESQEKRTGRKRNSSERPARP